MSDQLYDVAIVGGGPAGLQAALMLARTRKKIAVFDSPHPPRNSASHGVHNFVGLDGLLPSQIKEQAWQQISVYQCAELYSDAVVDILREEFFILQTENGRKLQARQVILAMGFRDIYPDIASFLDCWGKTIIPCPFCDGYENRDRVWGIVADSQNRLDHLPLLAQMTRNWTKTVKILLSSQLSLSMEQQSAFAAHNIPIEVGDIVAIDHTKGSLESVTLNSGEKVPVETLIWHPQEAPTELTQRVVATFQLEVDDDGHLITDANHQTAIQGLWAVGDVKGWVGALGAAFAASQAAAAIVRGWYP